MKNTQFISLIVLIFVWIWSTHYILSKIPGKILATNLAIEYDKVWGMENYVKINDLQREQVIAWLKQYEAQKGEADSNVNNAPVVEVPSNAWSYISLEQAKEVVSENTYILWNPDAEISFVEYSDLECPFCKKLHEAGTIDKVLEEYDWKVNFIFKQFPLGFHAQAGMEAEAALCAWEIAWSDKYYEFIEVVFKNSKTNGRSYTKDSISELGSTIGIDKTELLSCIDSGKFTDLAKSQTNEGSSLFGITWTPWNVFINNKTWEWDKLPWAYPFESFKQKIDSLIK